MGISGILKSIPEVALRAMIHANRGRALESSASSHPIDEGEQPSFFLSTFLRLLQVFDVFDCVLHLPRYTINHAKRWALVATYF